MPRTPKQHIRVKHLKDVDIMTLDGQLQDAGFTNTFIWNDEPGTQHETHQHEHKTAHIIIHGSMQVAVDGTEKTYARGDRFDIDAGVPHTVSVGNDGCVYMIGEKVQ